ncbi:MAG: nicotinamide riboside transporter PnuC [Bacteroidota bacterium]
MVLFEYLGAITGVVGIWLTMRQLIWCFPVGLLSVSISCYVFFHAKLYADALQQVVFASLLVLGWIRWSDAGFKLHHVTTLKAQSRLLWLCTTLATGIALGYTLDNYTDAHYPYVDSILTALCFLAQYMIAQRKIENWWLWIFTNTAYILVYIKKDLEPYAGLYFIYLVMAFIGLREWHRKMKIVN